MPCQSPALACTKGDYLVNFFLRAHHGVDLHTQPCKKLWSTKQVWAEWAGGVIQSGCGSMIKISVPSSSRNTNIQSTIESYIEPLYLGHLFSECQRGRK